MKKNILKSAFLLAIIGGFSTACTVEPVPGQPEETPTFTCLELNASLTDAQTKTSLGSVYQEGDVSKAKVLWSKGDQISINGILSTAVKDEDHGKAEVRFRVEGNLEKPYNVLYPGTTEKNVITLPATQNYVANSHDAAAYAAYGKVEEKGGEYTATLNNFCGLVRFALNGSATLTNIEVNALGGEKLHGNFSLATDANGFTGSFTGGTEGTLTYNFGSGLKLTGTDTYVYIALPAQTYAAGVEAKVYQADGAFMRLKFWGDGEVLAGSELRAFASKTYAAGRTEHLTSLEDLNAENGGAITVPVGITVATFNCLRFDDKDRSSDAITTKKQSNALWRPANAISKDNQNVKDALGKVIYNTHADIIGFNEVGSTMYKSGLSHSIEDMAKSQNCNKYNYKFYTSDEPGWLGEKSSDYKYANGFAYNPEILELEASNRAWYETTGTTNYKEDKKGDAGDPDRTYIWARFKHIKSGKVFWFFVTHLPTDETNNTKAANGINNFARAKAGSAPKILVGDMNNVSEKKNAAGATKLLEYWTDAYDKVKENGNLSDYYLTYSGTQSGSGYNYHYSIEVYTKNHPERRIDHIMTQGACSPTTYETIRTTYTVHYSGQATDHNGNIKENVEEDIPCYPSDHLAVVSYITLD